MTQTPTSPNPFMVCSLAPPSLRMDKTNLGVRVQYQRLMTNGTSGCPGLGQCVMPRRPRKDFFQCPGGAEYLQGHPGSKSNRCTGSLYYPHLHNPPSTQSVERGNRQKTPNLLQSRRVGPWRVPNQRDCARCEGEKRALPYNINGGRRREQEQGWSPPKLNSRSRPAEAGHRRLQPAR